MTTQTPKPTRNRKRMTPVAPPSLPLPKGKLGAIVGLMGRPKGATLAELMTASGWQAHSVRGVIAGAIKKKLKLTVISEKPGPERIYRIEQGAQA